MNKPFFTKKQSGQNDTLPTVTVGIAAHNEGQNIMSLLESLFLQEGNFILKEVFVVCDGCTDDTESQALWVAEKHPEVLRVFNDKQRKGKVGRVNEMFAIATSDAFVQFDADIKLSDSTVIHKMITPIVSSTKAGLTFANCIPLSPQTQVEAMMDFETRAWNRAVESSGEDAEFHRCLGRARAFSIGLYKNFPIPDEASSNEDAFSFLFAKENHFKTVYISDAVVWYRLPSTMQDYLKQMARCIKSERQLTTWFKEETITRYRDSVHWGTKIKALVVESLHASVSEIASFFFLHSLALLYSRSKSTVSGVFWEPIESSKKL